MEGIHDKLMQHGILNQIKIQLNSMEYSIDIYGIKGLYQYGVLSINGDQWSYIRIVEMTN